MRAILLRALFCLPWAACLARAQSVHWDPPGGTLAVGEASTLQLVFEDCDPKDTPAPPQVPGLTLSYGGQSTSVSIINGAYSHSVSCSYSAILSRKQAVEIPSFDVETSKGRVKVAAARFEPVGAVVGGGQSLESAAHSRLEAEPATVWAGEVFTLEYTIQAARSYYPDFGRGVFDWNSEPLVVEDWSAPETFESRSGAEPESGLVRRTRAIAHQPGSHRLNPINQIVNLSVGVTGFGFFQQRQYQQFSVSATSPTIDVRPLPPAPADFTGAVGTFKISSKIVPKDLSVGDPVTWTIQLTGTGNWPDITGLRPREVSRDFQVIQPKAKRTPAEGKLFDSTLSEDVVLVPTKPGTYALEPVRFTYFDPKSGSYETITAPGSTVEVAAETSANAGSPRAGSPASISTEISAGLSAPAPSPAVAIAPSGLPRDPLAANSPASRPMRATPFVLLLAAPFLVFFALWLWFAGRLARRTDPERKRREARARLAVVLEMLRKNGSGEAMRPLLLSWQRDSAVMWRLMHAAPTPSLIADPAWSALWAEAERAVYGPDSSLPTDWMSRAQAALSVNPVPGFTPAQLFKPRNLLPFLFAFLALVFGVLPGRLGAASDSPAQLSPESSYRLGDFAAAEKGWRAELVREPDSWTARHNLSLALAQQDHWDEAAAQAVAAFVQKPEDPAVRWQFALACEKAGFVPDSLAEFISPGMLQWLARLASPAEWQRYALVSAWLAAAGLAAGLAAAFGAGDRHKRRTIAIGIGLLAVAAIGGVSSAVGWKAYGTAADPSAGIVWRNSSLRSIPTEADTAQKTTPLPAGSIAKTDRRFLGWVRLTFDNGQTGWVRKEEVVWLWQ
jgi:hypothetical protein